MGMMSEFKEFAVKGMCSTWPWGHHRRGIRENRVIRGQ